MFDATRSVPRMFCVREGARMFAPWVMPLRATTRRELLFGDTVARAGCDMFGRATTRLAFVFVAARAVWRGTTRRSPANFVVLTTVFMGLKDWDVVTPGFKFVRIWLFKYGYM